MKAEFTCAVRQQNQIVMWAHVVAEDTHQAVHATLKKIPVKGRCAIEIYRGGCIPFNPEEAPVATTTVIV